MAEMTLDLLIQEEIERWGFVWHWHQEGDVRTLELLGPDSPGEYVYSFDRRECADGTVQDLARQIYWWIVERGRVYAHGEFVNGLGQEAVSRR